MKKKNIGSTLLAGALGAIVAYIAVDGIQYLAAKNRGQEKTSGLFQFKEDEGGGGRASEGDPYSEPRTSGELTNADLKSMGCTIVSTGFAGGYIWQCPDGTIFTTV